MNGKLPIDSNKYLLLQESGLKSPDQRLSCLNEVVQDAVLESFGNLMPAIHTDGSGAMWYEHYDEESRETTSMARPLEQGELWPWHEADRLAEGWQRLQRRAEQLRDPRLRAFLLDFVLPDPTTQSKCYRLYEDTEGVPRLHVLWGIVPKDARQQTLPTGQVCEIVKSGLTTAIHQIAVAPHVPVQTAAVKGTPDQRNEPEQAVQAAAPALRGPIRWNAQMLRSIGLLVVAFGLFFLGTQLEGWVSRHFDDQLRGDLMILPVIKPMPKPSAEKTKEGTGESRLSAATSSRTERPDAAAVGRD